MTLDRFPGEEFCAACGSNLEVKEVEGKPRPVCVNCQRAVYHDPKIAATCVVQRGGKILMIRRDNPVGYGLWSMPGGYIDRGEVLEEGAAREVLEETGLQVEVQGLVGLFSEAGHPVVVVAYAAVRVDASLVAAAIDDAVEGIVRHCGGAAVERDLLPSGGTP